MQRAGTCIRMLVGLLLIMVVSVRAAGPEGMRLYVFTSGAIGGFAKSALQIGGQGNVDWAPVGFYIRHYRE